MMDDIMKKRCGKCGKTKMLNEFYKKKATKDGYCAMCKLCMNIYRLAHYKENKEKVRKSQGVYYKKNKEKIEKRQGIYRKENKEKIRKRQIAYCEKLSDVYIKTLIFVQYDIVRQDITPEMVRTKRDKITAYRKRSSEP